MLSKPNLDIDLIRSPNIIYLFVVFAVSRIPFLDLGFSAFTSETDQDVLAVVNSAYLLRFAHVYTVSRFPGSPFYEGINALFIDGGWIATNTATAVITFISIIIFAKILNCFKIENKAVLVFTFSFMPVIWINSVITMDFMWALMFILMGSYLAFSGRYLPAGIAMGLGVASRFTSGFMIIPVAYWAFTRRVETRDVVHFTGAFISTSVLAFLPVFSRYGFEFLRGSGFLTTTPLRRSVTAAAGSEVLAFHTMVMELFGIAAFVMLIFFVILTFKNKSDHPSGKNHLLNFCWLTVSIFILLYFIFPYKVAYLIPIVPFGLIILNEKLRRTFTIIICILLLLNGFISVAVTYDDGASITVEPGLVIRNYEARASKSVEISAQYLESLSDLVGGNNSSR